MVARITSQHLVRSLAIQHYLDSRFVCQAEYSVLGVNTGTPEWLSLSANQVVKVAHQLLGTRSDLMHRATGMAGNQIHPLLFRELPVIGDKTESVQIDLRLQMANSANNRRRVDTAGEGCANRHIASQMQRNTLQEQSSQLLTCFVKADIEGGIGRRGPVTNRLFDTATIYIHRAAVAGGKLSDLLKQRVFPMIGSAELQIVVGTLGAHLPFATG